MTKTKTTEVYKITSDSMRTRLTQILVRNEVAQAIFESWLDGRNVDIPEGMTPRVECDFSISIVPIPTNQNGNVE